jgi:hypothetical protein
MIFVYILKYFLEVIFFFSFYFIVPGIKPNALCTLGEHCTNELHPQPLKDYYYGWVLVAQAYNPIYSGGRDQED